jgi:hypothetical protein
MSSATLKWIAIATVALLVLMIVVDQADRSDTVTSGELLMPGLKDRINDIDKVTVTAAEAAESVTIARSGDEWLVVEKDSFPADVGKLREVLLALADARKLEQKTANPERLAQLGVAGPEAGNGTLLEIAGDDLQFAVIVGNVAQGKNRYVRMADDSQSWLIDKNPDLPATGGGWLAAELLDIDAARVQSVSISHADGETIRLSKTSQDAANYNVADIPEGRELSYATVANGIAGVLNDLTLEDVRRSDAGELATTSVFTTFDGLEISVRRYTDGDDAWLALTASVVAPAITEAPAEAPAEATSEVEPGEEEAGTINARLAGWQYRIPEYKANLLARRWDDILKAEGED